MRVYFDNCCLNRPFDDQKQLRIKLETEAKLEIQQKVIDKKIQLAWSYILDFENSVNPFDQRRIVIQDWKEQAYVDTNETDTIIKQAHAITEIGINSKDALHIACAIELECDYFLTTDDLVLKKGNMVTCITITDPIDFIRKEYDVNG